jgi:aryl-alcohol dehydrogenase-like predicted oxidoreductase
MQHRRIGSLSVSLVGLGCNNFGIRLNAERTAAVVDAALDAGINFFDTADVYGKTLSEEFLGRALGKRRESVVIASKFGLPLDAERRGGARPEYLKRAVEESLRRLGTDRIDVYQLHKPDPEVPIAETLGALDALVREGKVREIGCSNFTAAQIDEAERAVKPTAARFVSVQNEYSLLHRAPEQGVLDAVARHGIAFLPYFPLASGLLTGKYEKGAVPEGARLTAADGALTTRFRSQKNVAVAEALAAFAGARGHTLLELAFSFLLSRPVVASVIAGATSAAQVQANVAAAGRTLDAGELAEIDRIAPI